MAMTILLVMVLLFGQMLSFMSKAWMYGHGRANNFTKARAMLDLLAEDIQDGVFRSDLTAFPTSGTSANPPYWEFYTARPGIPSAGTSSSALRTLSVVQYTFIGPSNPNGGIPNTLERADSPILWADEGANPALGNTTGFSVNPTPRDTAPGVIAFDFVFIQSNGTFSATFTPISTAGVVSTNPTRGVSVTLAVVDDATLLKLSSTQLTNLNLLLTNTVADNPPTKSIKSYWDTYLNSPAMNWSAYPSGTGAGVATFERYVTLPTAP